jgi:CO/xanthine dehydrogenase Mo-binding subunit
VSDIPKVDAAPGESEIAVELVQHEVARLSHLFTVNRRDVFKLLGAGLVVGVCARAPLAQESGGRMRSEQTPHDIDSWLHIGADGKITVFTGKVEMGQNIRTSLAQQVAEELRTQTGSITMIMGDTDLTPFDLGTFGSRSTPQMGTQLRNVGVVARETLIDMAAQRWHVDRSLVLAHDGAVTNSRTKQSLSYSQLTEGQKLVKLVEDPPLTPASQWQVAGRPAPKVDGKAFVTGAHQYTSDITRPGMMYGAVLRPNAFNARLASLDIKQAEQLSNIKVVHDGDFVGVAAADPESARNALELINADWSAPQQISESALFDSLRQPGDGEARGGNRESGSIEKGMAGAAKTLSQTYTVAYIQHAPLEPRAAVAEWEGNKLTVWTGTQRPFAVREELSSAFHLQLEQVRVIVPDTGSAYGGKHTGECAVEAAMDARRGVHLGLFSSGGRDRGEERGRGRRHDNCLGISQLQLRAGGHRNALQRSQPEDTVSPGKESAATPGILSRSGGYGQLLRAREPYGRACSCRGNGSAEISPQESLRSAAAESL